MSSLNDIILIITKEKVTCFEAEPCIHQNVEDKIKFYDDLLEKLTIPRAKINELKEKKDNLVKQYINETKAPKSLDIELLNYKALLFYFIENFIQTPLKLQLEDYEKNGDLQSGFRNFFSGRQIKISSKIENFPHLIGVKHQHQNINKFLNGIFYETKLLEDYEDHKRDVDKIKVFSWIRATLLTPTYIFGKDAIQAKKFTSDLTFARRIEKCEYNWHIVGLRKMVGKDFFVFQSNFPIKTEGGIYNKFDVDKKLYKGWKV